MARRWPAADQRELGDDGVKSLVRRAIIPLAGVAELADAQDLKSWVSKEACGFDSRPRHHKTKDLPTATSARSRLIPWAVPEAVPGSVGHRFRAASHTSLAGDRLVEVSTDPDTGT